MKLSWYLMCPFLRNYLYLEDFVMVEDSFCHFWSKITYSKYLLSLAFYMCHCKQHLNHCIHNSKQTISFWPGKCFTKDKCKFEDFSLLWVGFVLVFFFFSILRERQCLNHRIALEFNFFPVIEILSIPRKYIYQHIWKQI